MSGSNEFGKIAEGLTVGQAVWMTPTGEVERLAVPNTTAHHIDLVARVVSGQERAPVLLPVVEPLTEPRTPPRKSTDDGEHVVSDDADPLSVGLSVDATRAALVRELYRQGKTRNEILREVWQVDAKQGGRRFTVAAREFDEILSALLGGGIDGR